MSPYDPCEAEKVFLCQHSSLSAMLDAGDRVCQQGGQLYGTCVGLSTDIGTLLDRLTSGRGRRRGFRLLEGTPHLVELDVESADSPGGTTVGKLLLWQSSGSGAAYMVSCQRRDVFEPVRDVVVHYLQPEVTRVYLHTPEIRAVLRQLAREQVTVRVKEYVARSLIDDPESAKRVKTEREWTDEDHTAVFRKLSEGRQWLSSIRLEVRGDRAAVGRVSRDSSFSAESGFSYLFETVLGRLGSATAESREFYEKRDRSSSPTGAARPLSIRYGSDVFADKRQKLRLLKVLNRLPDSSLTVLHPNPYLHASLVDYVDGSSCDIWVTTPTSVLLVPRSKTSPGALERLCNAICDGFEEGVVEEFAPK